MGAMNRRLFLSTLVTGLAAASDPEFGSAEEFCTAEDIRRYHEIMAEWRRRALDHGECMTCGGRLDYSLNMELQPRCYACSRC
jgi:hypothetical protein